MFSVGSKFEDGMLEAVRQIEAQVDRALGAFSSGAHMIDAAQASSEQAATDASAQALIREVWEVVDTSYMDARHSGFDHDKWAALRDAALGRSYRDQASVHRAVREMLAQGVGDPYCRFIPTAEFASMKKYDVTGVGLNLGTAEEYTKKTGRALPQSAAADPNGGVWVVGLSKGSEADRAGMEQGDELLRVADMDLSGISPFQAATLVAGPDDSSTSSAVNLMVRKADGRLLDLTVQRPARSLASPVVSSMQQGGGGRRVGTIRLASFNARALRDVSAALQQLQQRGATELVLDLRDNRGGLVSEGLEVARLFLADRVPIVLTQSKAMAAEPPRAAAAAATQLPLTVLVNEHTASASEILAGALKDNCRGVLVGKRTYGKGLIQSVYELSDSSGLVITVGKYLTPRGTDIDRFGIAPDFGSQPAARQAAAVLDACRLDAGQPQQQRLRQQLVVELAAANSGGSRR
ncbi:ClpP/crotonase [Scenedesmus sp. NREL 46B-D3]|nr:ClpP/crotonase [Scenedesmus sp. NREL 46B-D3]